MKCNLTVGHSELFAALLADKKNVIISAFNSIFCPD